MTILWLNRYYFVLLDCFVSVLLFFTSLIKFFLFGIQGRPGNPKAFLQARGCGEKVEEMGEVKEMGEEWGGCVWGLCPQEDPTGSCVHYLTLCTTIAS